MSTQENIMAAFAGESQANRKYLAFAKKAEKEGFKNLARLFLVIAEAETIHALKHLEVAGKIGDTQHNLKSALEGEIYEFTSMYPEFIAQAEKDDNKNALKAFKLALEAEKVHGNLFEQFAKGIQEGKEPEAGDFYLCPVCGYVEIDHLPEKCPICGALGKAFKKY